MIKSCVTLYVHFPLLNVIQLVHVQKYVRMRFLYCMWPRENDAGVIYSRVCDISLK